MPKAPIGLGKLQLRIMQVLWSKGETTARAITDQLNREEPIAHSTVQTLLRKMEAKGLIEHTVHDRMFTFRPLVDQMQIKETAANDVLKRVFAGSALGLVSHLLKTEKIGKDELNDLRALIDAYSEQDGDNRERG